MKELLKTLCALNGVSGDEDQVREFLAERARPWARSMKVDPLGNRVEEGGQSGRGPADAVRPHG